MQPYQFAAHVCTARDEAAFVTGNMQATRRDFLGYVLTDPKGERIQRAGMIIFPGKNQLDLLQMANSQRQGAPVQAYIEANRWLARCHCGGAETVDPQDPEFFCFSCFNAENDGNPRPVEFPKGRQGIEEELRQVTERTARNWRPENLRLTPQPHETLHHARAQGQGAAE